MFLVLNRLKAEYDATSEFSQALFDAMFADLDRGLREMGATDIGVGKRVKEMAKGFYGRIKAYEDGPRRQTTTMLAPRRCAAISMAPCNRGRRRLRRWSIISAIKSRLWPSSRSKNSSRTTLSSLQ